MSVLLLIIIYASFISLGLPDGMLGAAWPLMHKDFAIPLGEAGYVTLIISCGTIIASLFSVKALKKFGTGKVTLFSVFLTAIALLGFYIVPSYKILFVLGLPLGLGAGAVDSGLNEYVAEHYKASHMNFLHSFWGIGALSGPLIMSGFIKNNNEWRYGYLTVAIVQFVLVFVLFLSIPVWNKMEKTYSLNKNIEDTKNVKSKKSIFSSLKIKGIVFVLLSFGMYCGIEGSVGLWGASYLVSSWNMPIEKAAAWVSLFYAGIMVGRFLCGFLAMKFSTKALIRTGEIFISFAVVCLLLAKIFCLSPFINLFAFVLIGLGCAPIFPGMLHETPNRFGKENAQAIMGFQMAVAYTSSSLLPPVFGIIANKISIGFLPWALLLFIVVLFLCCEITNKNFKNKSSVI